MTQAASNLDFIKITPEPSSLQKFVNMLRKIYTNLVTNVINGHIGFGDGSKADNIDGVWSNVIAPAAPNTDFTITHNLGRVPVGYWVMQKDRACDVYTGSVAATKTQLTLRATVASAVLRLFVVSVLLFFGATARAQTTAVTLQVTDAGTQIWLNGSWSVVLVSKAGAVPFGPPFNVIGGGGSVPNQSQSGALDGTGSASMTLTPNASIVPAQSQWRFTVCPQATSPCFTQAFVIAGATQTVTPVPPAIFISCETYGKTYQDSQVGCTQGGFYFNLVSNRLRQCTSSTPPNACNTWIDVGSGATSAAGSPPQTQVNDPGNPGHFGGTPCENFPSLTVGPINADCDWHSKGPNPYADATRYNIRPISANAIPAIAGITANTTSGNAQVTVSTAFCAGQANNICFVNGDGVTIYGVGSAITMSTPGAPTITPSNAVSGTGTGIVVNAPTGSTTFNYKVLACDIGGGCTAASSTGTTTTGNALGAQNQSISSITRSNDTVTFVMASQPNFSAGTVVHVDGCSAADNQNGFCGWYLAATVSGTGFTSTQNVADTRNGAAGISNGGAVANWWSCNHVSWSAVAGAFRYVVQSDRQNPGTFANIAMSWVVNPLGGGTQDGTLFLDDFGQTMMARSASSIPGYVPSNGAATNDVLTTTIVSGANTTTLTLAVAPSLSLGSQTILFDAAPNIVSMNNTVTGPIEFPFTPPSTSYVTNSVMSLIAHNNPLLFPSGATFKDTVITGTQTSWYGDRIPGAASATSFQPKSLPQIVFSSSPGLLIGSGATGEIRGIEFGGSPNGIAVQQDGGGGNLGFNYDFVNFAGAASSNDYMSMGFLCRGQAGTASCVSRMGTVFITAGTQAQSDATFTPSAYWDVGGDSIIENLMASARGFIFKSDPAGGGFYIGSYHWQANTAPVVTVDNTLGSTGILIGNSGQAIIDTGPNAAIFNVGNGGKIVTASCGINLFGCGSPASGLPSFSGQRTSSNTGTFSNSGQNRNSFSFSSGLASDGLLAANQQYSSYAGLIANGSIAAGSAYPILQVGNSVAKPTCSVSAGGSVPIGTYTFFVAPIWQNNGEGQISTTSAPCSTTSGNQTVTVNWTNPGGSPKFFNLYTNGLIQNYNSLGCGNQLISGAASSLVITSMPFNCTGGGTTQIPAGGPTMLMPGIQGIATPALIDNGFAVSGPFNAGTMVVSSYQNSVYDNFNRANGAIGSNWTTGLTGAFTISGNTATGPGGGGQATSFWNANTFSTTTGLFSQDTITNLGGTAVGAGLFISSGLGYVCRETATTYDLLRVAGQFSTSTIATTAITGVVGDVVRIELGNIAGALTCYRNGASILTGSDTNVSPPFSPGIYGVGTPVALDNWSGGNLHPIAQLDTEQDWTQPQHFTQPVTIGATNPVAGALATNTLYVPNITTTGVATSGITFLNSQPNAAAITGNGTNLTLFTYSLPANQVATNRAIRVSAGYSHSTGSGSVTYGLNLNGQNVSGYSVTNTGPLVETDTIINLTSTTGSRMTVAPAASNGGASSALTGLAWTSAQTLTLFFNSAGTEQVTPLFWLVELIP